MGIQPKGGADVSVYAQDPVIGPLIAQFLKSTVLKADLLREAVGSHRWQKAMKVSHQIKGSASSFGFREISKAAATVEETIRLFDKPRVLVEAVDRLVAIVRLSARQNAIDGAEEQGPTQAAACSS